MRKLHRHLVRPLFAALSLLLVFSGPGSALAFTNQQFSSQNGNSPYYIPGDTDVPICSTASGSTNGPASLAGHTLPDTHGFAGDEEAINAQGEVGSTGQKVSFWQNAAKGQNFRDYYITMRWRYAKWDWSGAAVLPGPETVDFYSQAPRVLVTNPRTGKSIIAVIMEAGPAPWVGVDTNPNNTPKQGWTNPQDGTPSSYTGIVAGFPPVAKKALGYVAGYLGQKGDDLLYSWAPDQNAQPGPVGGTSATITGTTPSSDPSTCDNTTSSTGTVTCKSAAGVTGGTALGTKVAQIAMCEAEAHVIGYMKYTPANEEWCADFVSWVYKQAGSPFTNGGGRAGPWDISGVSALADWLRANGVYVDNKAGAPPPQIGDVVIHGYGEHTNIVVGIHGSTLTVVGGNQGEIHDNSKSLVSEDTINNYTNTDITGWGRKKQ